MSRLGGGEPSTPKGWLFKAGAEYGVLVLIYSPRVPWPKLQDYVRRLIGAEPAESKESADAPAPADTIPLPDTHSPDSRPLSGA